MQKSIKLWLLCSAFTLAVQSAPTGPFVKQTHPAIDDVPSGKDHIPDDTSLPKVVPIPVKFINGEPHFLLTQVRKSNMKAPEFPRGKAKKGEASWQTGAREAYEEVGAVGNIDHSHKIHDTDGKKALIGHILTVPVDEELHQTKESQRRISEFHHHSIVENKLERPEMKRLFHGALERINNINNGH